MISVTGTGHFRFLEEEGRDPSIAGYRYVDGQGKRKPSLHDHVGVMVMRHDLIPELLRRFSAAVRPSLGTRAGHDGRTGLLRKPRVGGLFVHPSSRKFNEGGDHQKDDRRRIAISTAAHQCGPCGRGPFSEALRDKSWRCMGSYESLVLKL